MERREPEQLNQADAPEEYQLDDILREFGAGAEEPKKSVSSDTMTFQPIRSAPVDPQLDVPTKTAKPKKSRSLREKLKKSESEPQEPKQAQREEAQQLPTRKETPVQMRAP